MIGSNILKMNIPWYDWLRFWRYFKLRTDDFPPPGYHIYSVRTVSAVLCQSPCVVQYAESCRWISLKVSVAFMLWKWEFAKRLWQGNFLEFLVPIRYTDMYKCIWHNYLYQLSSEQFISFAIASSRRRWMDGNMYFDLRFGHNGQMQREYFTFLHMVMRCSFLGVHALPLNLHHRAFDQSPFSCVPIFSLVF